MLREWVTNTIKKRTDPDQFCPFETGRQILTIPESEFIQRLMTINPKLGEKSAKDYYMKLWDLFLQARTAKKYNLRKAEKAAAIKR